MSQSTDKLKIDLPDGVTAPGCDVFIHDGDTYLSHGGCIWILLTGKGCGVFKPLYSTDTSHLTDGRSAYLSGKVYRVTITSGSPMLHIVDMRRFTSTIHPMDHFNEEYDSCGVFAWKGDVYGVIDRSLYVVTPEYSMRRVMKNVIPKDAGCVLTYTHKNSLYITSFTHPHNITEVRGDETVKRYTLPVRRVDGLNWYSVMVCGNGRVYVQEEEAMYIITSTGPKWSKNRTKPPENYPRDKIVWCYTSRHHIEIIQRGSPKARFVVTV